MSDSPPAGFVEATVRGRYLLRPAGPQAAPLLVGFHGYGENADANLEALARIPGAEAWHLAAIQALHPFYNSRTRQVVASWMTRLDRERAIADNIRYVSAAIDAVADRLACRKPLVVAGFSQGTAMAYRTAAAGRPCDGVLALAGDLPPELADASWKARPRVLIGCGSEDTWYDEPRMAQDLELLRGAGIEAEGLVFAGGHEWSPAFLEAAGRFLDGLRAA